MDIYDPLAHYEKIEFGNGLNAYVLYQPDKSFARVSAVVHSGSWRDPDHLVGLAHFAEHMAIANCGMNQTELQQFFEGEGGDYSAFTSSFDTVYSFVAPCEEAVLRKFTDWLSRLCFGLDFADHLERERAVIMREYLKHITMDDMRNWHERRHRILFAGTPHARAMRPLGDLEGIKAVQIADIENFYRLAYVPGNMSLIVSGGLSPEQVMGMIVDSAFTRGSSCGHGRKLFKSIEEPIAPAESHFAYSVPGRPVTQGSHSLEVVVPDTVANETLQVFKKICWQMLFEEVRERQQLTYSAGASAVMWQSFCHLSVSVSSFDVAKTAQVEDGVRVALGRLLQSPERFALAKHICLMDAKVQDRNLKSIHDQARSDVVMFGRMRTLAEYVERLAEVNFTDVCQVTEMLLGNRAVTTVIRS